MKKQLVSLRDFFMTGTLGPVIPGMKMIEIAEAFGAPDDWITKYAETIPVYWIYGQLEASFDNEPPHDLNWFQIEHVHAIRSKTERITDQFALSMDGFDSRTKPSEFLNAGLWTPEEAMVFYIASRNDIDLNICAGPIQIYFRVDTDFIEDRDAEKYLNGVTVSQLISDIDHRTEIDSVYSYSHPAIEQITKAIDWKSISGRNYLNFARQEVAAPMKKGPQAP
ncbi:hypothetical protein NKJ81_24030 [Mesorhizobium sp. M0018]|uniref:hypothetical protein n=1 Tax=Mesorhizobium sp. M0018 TaxID=2956844 RepID=UPI00333D3AEC